MINGLKIALKIAICIGVAILIFLVALQFQPQPQPTYESFHALRVWQQGTMHIMVVAETLLIIKLFILPEMNR